MPPRSGICAAVITPLYIANSIKIIQQLRFRGDTQILSMLHFGSVEGYIRFVSHLIQDVVIETDVDRLVSRQYGTALRYHIGSRRGKSVCHVRRVLSNYSSGQDDVQFVAAVFLQRYKKRHMIPQRLIHRRECGQMDVILAFQPWIADSVSDIILPGAIQGNPVVAVYHQSSHSDTVPRLMQTSAFPSFPRTRNTTPYRCAY